MRPSSGDTCSPQWAGTITIEDLEGKAVASPLVLVATCARAEKPFKLDSSSAERIAARCSRPRAHGTLVRDVVDPTPPPSRRGARHARRPGGRLVPRPRVALRSAPPARGGLPGRVNQLRGVVVTRRPPGPAKRMPEERPPRKPEGGDSAPAQRKNNGGSSRRMRKACRYRVLGEQRPIRSKLRADFVRCCIIAVRSLPSSLAWSSV